MVIENKKTGYEKGKYAWSEATTNEIASPDALGTTIVDYAWSDGKKKVSVYVTLDGLDAIESEAITAKVLGERHVRLELVFPTGKRILDLQNLFGRVGSIEVTPKKGKNQLVLKIHKTAIGITWSSLVVAKAYDTNILSSTDLSDDDMREDFEDMNEDQPTEDPYLVDENIFDDKEVVNDDNDSTREDDATEGDNVVLDE
mmetsp:Transcript_666/g.850  ORF Transcript_666/g.850 Transcript_666/m.850 type:complete len:200 (-) Transcript_666:62-661(-)